MNNPISLETLCQGRVEELFSGELSRVLQNIADPNTDPTKERVIKLEIKIKPTMNRDSAAVKVSAASKLAAPLPQVATVFIEYGKGGVILASEYNGYDQPTLPFVNSND